MEDMEDGEDVEDGEVSSGGFLGHSEVANRNALAAACGEGRSWVEAVLTSGGGGAVNPIDGNDIGNKNESDGEDAEKYADASRYVSWRLAALRVSTCVYDLEERNFEYLHVDVLS